MENLKASLIGQWRLTEVYYLHKENGEIVEQATDSSPEGNVVIFEADGTGVYDEVMMWELSGGELVITDAYGSDRVMVESVTTDGLVLSSADHYDDGGGGILYDLYRDTYARIL